MRYLAITAAMFLTLHAGWFALAGHLPPRIEPRSLDVEHLEWVRPGVGPATVHGPREGIRTIICGDSRTRAAIDRKTLDQSEFGPTSVQWTGGTDLRDLLPFVIAQRPPILAVAFSPHSFGGTRSEMYEVIMDRKPPFLPPTDATVADVDSWRLSAEARLREAGLNPAFSVPILAALQRNFERQVTLEQWPHRRLDLTLEMEWTDARTRLLKTITCSQWKRSWMPMPHPMSSDVTYQQKLRGKAFRKGYRAAGREVAKQLLGASQLGIHVIAVRLPVSPSLRAIEDAAVGPEWLASVAEQAGIPYLDFGTSELSADGSHLTFEGALEFTAEFLESLRASDLSD